MKRQRHVDDRLPVLGWQRLQIRHRLDHMLVRCITKLGRQPRPNPDTTITIAIHRLHHHVTVDAQALWTRRSRTRRDGPIPLLRHPMLHQTGRRPHEHGRFEPLSCHVANRVKQWHWCDRSRRRQRCCGRKWTSEWSRSDSGRCSTCCRCKWSTSSQHRQ
jgi:hypothetical protein